MGSQFSERCNHVQASETREILKVTAKPEVISFAGGLPAPELFPIEDIKVACEAVLTESGQSALQYSTTEGYVPLRQEIVKRMKAIEIETSVDNVIITGGSQQGLDLTGKLFIDEGDTVICESPTYLAAINAFKVYNANFVEVAMDDDGMKMDELEKALKANPQAKFIYTIPDFQNPTGRTMKLDRRKKMVELANKYDIVILEDNPYGAVRFAGEALPPVKHFDTEGRVIYLSTFSKIFTPGLRLGWICADTRFIEKYVAFKQSADLHTDSFAQMITAKYMELFDIEAHILKIKEVYRSRREKMMQCIDKYFPKQAKHSAPEGGLFIWVELPGDIDTQDIFNECIKNNVAFVPGKPFFPNSAQRNTFRLNYSNMPEDRIEEGMKRLGEVLTRRVNEQTVAK
ncbi:aminotransferase class I/II-fold pyridoxal phosphate-dependent enzyme [Terrilactibacillus sp. BCM23-1]|uniref:Aminotransferase class I/II-fold pyridoxal phosphate-dependent enzyme n=1 Tax=Terrilactibacillus tamarindi TaxID=2599694 RepID=A0A6N8CR08_9BACI|nr:PLP-dependent aminotransferase family protein [Terrilactibacillus tamarindi]MTT32098.1 aminotransferase class I/II-fold pyridoxal phosphate-dependent enzyme [Terrilactibacillus tamarindi]